MPPPFSCPGLARAAAIFDAFGTRRIGAARMMATAIPLSLAVSARYALARRRGRVAAAPPSVDSGRGTEPVVLGSPVGDQGLRVEPERASAGVGKAV